MGLFRRKEKEEAYQALLLQLGRIASSLEIITQKDNSVSEQNSVDQLMRIASSLEENCSVNESQTQHEALAQLNRIAASLESNNESEDDKNAQASLDQLNRIAFALENGNVHDKAEEQQLSSQLVRIAETLDQQCKKKPDEITVAQLTQLTKIADSLERISSEKKMEQTLNDKLKAAYALNLCLVSISQIIDYSDLYVLEQEYEGILNNLNLEHMPKDEALLDILRQILDTITFFRIQEGDKLFIEQDYQNRMKTAIWKAVPSCNTILACTSPQAMLITLVTTVGTGYMNYRNEKVSAGREKEKAMWELHKAAIEQFNGLRRELFTTAWKLADNYGFKDEWRLTESQIAQYNRILTDKNYSRRLARLEDIEGKFDAYPPFWYFKGNTALKLSQENPEIRDDMLAIARDAYEKYFAVNSIDNELLRTDPICAACALEYVSLLPDTEKENKNFYIERAIKCAGTHFDILQMCAMAYLDIGERDKASQILKTLVCEEYNEGINAQLLSSLYIAGYLDRGQSMPYEKLYNRLCTFTNKAQLITWPEVGASAKEQYDQFVCNRRNAILEKYADFLCKYYAQKSNQFLQVFSETHESKEKAFVHFAKQIEADINSFPNVAIDNLGFAELMAGSEDGNAKTEDRKNKKENKTNKEEIENLIETKAKIKVTSELFDKLFGAVFYAVANNVANCPLSTMEEITELELKLHTAINAYLVATVSKQETIEPEYTLDSLFNKTNNQSDRFNKIKNEVRKRQSQLISNSKQTKLLIAGESEYYRYIKEHSLENMRVVAVINDKTLADCDLLITETGLIVHQWQSKTSKWAKSAILMVAGAASLGNPLGIYAGIAVARAFQWMQDEVVFANVQCENRLEKPYYSNKNVNIAQLRSLINSCRGYENEIEKGIRSKINPSSTDITFRSGDCINENGD